MVETDASEDRGLGFTGEVDSVREETVPDGCGGAEDGCYALAGGEFSQETVVSAVGYLGEGGIGACECCAMRTSAVQSHAGRPLEIVFVEAGSIDGLLGEDVAGCEEHGCRDCLGEEGLAGEIGLVPRALIA